MIDRREFLLKGLTLALIAGGCFSPIAPAGASHYTNYANATGGDTPDLNELDSSKSEMRPVIERYVADQGSLSRSYPVESSPARLERFKQFYSDWLALIGARGHRIRREERPGHRAAAGAHAQRRLARQVHVALVDGFLRLQPQQPRLLFLLLDIVGRDRVAELLSGLVPASERLQEDGWTRTGQRRRGLHRQHLRLRRHSRDGAVAGGRLPPARSHSGGDHEPGAYTERAEGQADRIRRSEARAVGRPGAHGREAKTGTAQSCGERSRRSEGVDLLQK